jgi:hypothetical protein
MNSHFAAKTQTRKTTQVFLVTLWRKIALPINHGNELETDADKDDRPSGQ